MICDGGHETLLSTRGDYVSDSTTTATDDGGEQVDVDGALEEGRLENPDGDAVEELLTSSAGEVRELDMSSETPALKIFTKIHPIGIVAAVALIVGIIGTVAFDTERLFGNLGIGHWLALIVTIGLSLSPPALNGVRAFLEVFSNVTKSFVWILAWAVFIVQLINVITRYLNPFFEQDILLGQLTALAWQLFALIALLGLNHGVKAEVNPRIDFWWAEWTDRTKAWLDFVLHTSLLLPFLWVSFQVLQTSSAGALGRRRGDGVWPSGWRVWETWEQAPDADQLPVGPIKAIILVGFVFFFLQVTAQVIKTGFVLMGQRGYAQLSATDEFQRIE